MSVLSLKALTAFYIVQKEQEFYEPATKAYELSQQFNEMIAKANEARASFDAISRTQSSFVEPMQIEKPVINYLIGDDLEKYLNIWRRCFQKENRFSAENLIDIEGLDDDDTKKVLYKFIEMAISDGTLKTEMDRDSVVLNPFLFDTILLNAIQNNCEKIVEILLNHPIMEEILLKYPSNISSDFFDNDDPRHIEMKLERSRGYIDKRLSFEDSGFTFLGVAVERGNRNIVKLLLNRGACKHLPQFQFIQGFWGRGLDPVEIAIQNEDFKMVELFLDEDINSAAFSRKKCPALHLAAYYGKLEIVRKLVEKGADCTLRARNFFYSTELTAFEISLKAGQRDVCEYFFQKLKYDINSIKLIPSCFESRNTKKILGVLELLLSYGADINRKYDSRTVLHYAAGISKKMVEFLLNNGADMSITDECNVSALDLAQRYYSEIPGYKSHKAKEKARYKKIIDILQNHQKLKRKKEEGTSLELGSKKRREDLDSEI